MSKPVCINITIAESPGGGRQRRERLPSRVSCLHVLGSAHQLRCAVRMETEAGLAEKSRCVCVCLWVPRARPMLVLASGARTKSASCLRGSSAEPSGCRHWHFSHAHVSTLPRCWLKKKKSRFCQWWKQENVNDSLNFSQAWETDVIIQFITRKMSRSSTHVMSWLMMWEPMRKLFPLLELEDFQGNVLFLFPVLYIHACFPNITNLD